MTSVFGRLAVLQSMIFILICRNLGNAAAVALSSVNGGHTILALALASLDHGLDLFVGLF